MLCVRKSLRLSRHFDYNFLSNVLDRQAKIAMFCFQLRFLTIQLRQLLFNLLKSFLLLLQFFPQCLLINSGTGFLFNNRRLGLLYVWRLGHYF